MEVQIKRNVHSGKVTSLEDAQTGSSLGLFSKAGIFYSSSQRFSDWLLSQSLPISLINREGIPYKLESKTSRVGDDVRGSVIKETWQEFHVDTIVEWEGIKIRAKTEMVRAEKLKNMLDYLHH